MNYPIKRRGVPRRLDPNWDGIRWLEEESADDTEIYQEEVFPDDGIKYIRAYGRGQKSYPRPMFQIIPRDAFSGAGPSVAPCQCDRFDQSWACPDHPEVAWDAVRRRWKRPCTGDRTRCECDPCFERRQRAAAPDRCTCSMCNPRSGYSYEETVLRDNRAMREEVMHQARITALRTGWPVTGQVLGRPAQIDGDGSITFLDRRGSTNVDRIRYVGDPNEGRPGYRYQFATDRWVRDVEAVDPPLVEVSPQAYTGIDISNLTTVPDELMGPTREEWMERLVGMLPDMSVQLSGTFTGSFTLEIDCETEQGAGPLAIEVAPTTESRDPREPSDGRTPTFP